MASHNTCAYIRLQSHMHSQAHQCFSKSDCHSSASITPLVYRKKEVLRRLLDGDIHHRLKQRFSVLLVHFLFVSLKHSANHSRFKCTSCKALILLPCALCMNLQRSTIVIVLAQPYHGQWQSSTVVECQYIIRNFATAWNFAQGQPGHKPVQVKTLQNYECWQTDY